jgi:two-component system sensor histidine kinase/response regulator
MTNRILRVLYVEDSERDANLLTRHLTGAGYELTSERVETRAAMRSALEAQDWDVILCDHSMPHFDAFAALALLQEMVRDIPFVVISIAGETAVEAMRLGAHDYLLKDNLVRLVPIIEREMHESANRRARRKAEAELRHSEAQYRRLIDTAYEGIWITDAEARITYANQRLAEMLGFAVEEMIGRFAFDFIDADSAELKLTWHRGLSEIGEQYDLHLRRKDGSDLWVILSATSTPDEPGQATDVLVMLTDITKRKLIEADLAASEALLKQFVEYSPAAIAMLDTEMRYLEVSQRWLTDYNLVGHNLIGRSHYEVFPDIPERWKDVHRRCLAGAVESSDEDTFPRADGTLEWMEWEIRPWHKPGRQIGGIILFTQVITERKRVEQALAEAVRREHASIENAPDVICSLDAEGLFVSVSPASLKVFGYRPEEMIGRHYTTFVVAEDIPKTADMRTSLFSGLETTDFENRYRHRNGSSVYIMWTAYWSESEHLMFAVARDITARKLIELDLRENELQLVEAEHIALMGNWTWDIATNTTVWSDALYYIYGLRPEDHSPTFEGYLNVVHPDDREYVSGLVQTVLQTGKGLSYEHRIFSSDKSVRFHHVNLKVALDEAGHPIRLYGTSQDVTDRVQLREELKRARDAAIESTRLKSQFLANMSHEIRTPMNGVIGMTDLLLNTALSAEQRSFTEAIDSSAESLMTVINDILDFSKIEAGLLHFEKIDFDLRGAVEASVELLAGRTHAKGLELASLVHTDVPTALRGDPGRLRQVLTNLIGNAIKFTDRGEVVVTVTKVSETTTSGILRFEIRDTGIGISTEAQGRLFQSFTQADGSTTRKYGGTGLGLAISKQLVELMGGQIGILSPPGRGSIFWFTAEFEKQSQPVNTAERMAAKMPGRLSGARVLIVDDNATNRTILKHQTTSWGMIATESNSSRRALELLSAGATLGQPYDVAILDLMMPNMDGLQLAEAIKADPSIAGVAVVLLPSYGEAGQGERARQAGIAACLQKPVRESQLYDCLSTVMARSAGAELIRSARPVTPKNAHQAQSPKAEVPRQDRHFSNARIIIAEDNIVNQNVAMGQLEDLGYRAEAVLNGRELLKALEDADFDLILMDCQMPKMDGFAATAEIRRREGGVRHTTIIAMTATAQDGDDQRCLAAGMDDYLCKPVKVAALRQKLERWIKPSAKPQAIDKSNEVGRVDGGAPADAFDLPKSASLKGIREQGNGALASHLIDNVRK